MPARLCGHCVSVCAGKAAREGWLGGLLTAVAAELYRAPDGNAVDGWDEIHNSLAKLALSDKAHAGGDVRQVSIGGMRMW